jgi:predicted AAA+ superfamily ATPase
MPAMYTRRLPLPARSFLLLGPRGELAYYPTPSGTEVDFVWRRGRLAVGIEVKASPRWRPEHGRALADLHGAGALTACFGVYLGDTPLRDGPIRVFPLRMFLAELSGGRVLAAGRRRF